MKRVKIIYFVAIFMAMLINIEAKEKIDAKLQVVLDLGGQMSNVRLMLESYALVGSGIPYSNPKDILKKSMKEYERV